MRSWRFRPASWAHLVRCLCWMIWVGGAYCRFWVSDLLLIMSVFSLNASESLQLGVAVAKVCYKSS